MKNVHKKYTVSFYPLTSDYSRQKEVINKKLVDKVRTTTIRARTEREAMHKMNNNSNPVHAFKAEVAA